MKRDLDLIRLILLDLEAHPEPVTGTYLFGSDVASFAYNMQLMIEHELVRASVFNPLAGYPIFTNVSATWAGNDFLDTVRDEVIWKKTKAGAKAAGGFSFDLIKALAKGLVKQKIQKHTGVEIEL